jgi:hypothetical protein
MLRDEIKQLKTGLADLRKFAFSVGGVLVLMGIIFLWRHKAHYPWLLYPGLVLIGLGVVAPASLKPIYLAWMSLALLLGLVVSTIFLTIFFFLVVTPIGLAARCLGKDFLERTWDGNATTYWIKRDASKSKKAEDYERQF